MTFSETFIKDIKLRLPISRVIETKVRFDPKKSNGARGEYWACCPFHHEKTPSFVCNDKKSTYHCFGCHEGGDIFSFLMKLEGLSFFQAVEKLANMAGLELPTPDKKDVEKQNSLAGVYRALDLACRFFEQELQKTSNAHILKYITDRGLTNETIGNFNIGYSPAKRMMLQQYLASKSITNDQMIRAGLIVKSQNGRDLYERFSDRVIFPIRDSRGRVVGFGGRSLSPDAKAKYINTSETELFIKGKLLYNFSNARENCYKVRKAGSYDQSISDNSEIIVVEGYMDVISLSQAGFGSVVAPLGTALNEDQMLSIWQVSHHPLLCFDGDKAGLRAAYRTIDKMLPILRHGVSIRFVLLPDSMDPDDIIKKQGSKAFVKCLVGSLSLIDLLWKRETEGKVFDTPEKCSELEVSLLRAVELIKDKRLKNHYNQMLKSRMRDLFFQLRRSSYNKAKPTFVNSAVAGLENSLSSTLELREKIILSLLIHYPSLCLQNYDDLSSIEFVDSSLNKIHKSILSITSDVVGEIPAEVIKEHLKRDCGEDAINEIEQKFLTMGGARLSEAKAGEMLKQSLYLYDKSNLLREKLSMRLHNPDMSDGDFYNLLVNVRSAIGDMEKIFLDRER